MRGRRATAVALALLAAVPQATAGCGIRPTGIVSAGSKPVSGSRPGPVTLFLLKNGKLVEVQRPGLPDHGTLGISQLTVPLTSEERRQGLTTQVPRIGLSPYAPAEGDEDPVEAPKGRSGAVLEVAAEEYRTWTRAALAQVACTAEKIRDVGMTRLEVDPYNDVSEEKASHMVTDEKVAPPKAARLLLRCSAFDDLK